MANKIKAAVVKDFEEFTTHKIKAAVVKDFEEFTTHKGEVIQIHSVPNLILKSVKINRPKPKRPQVAMQIKIGNKTEEQMRWAKSGDPEWEAYQADLEEWNSEQSALEDAVTKVLALRSYDVNGKTLLECDAAELVLPDYVQILIDSGVIDLPDNNWQRKAFWLDSCVLTQQDEISLTWVMQKLNGVPEDLIEQMKSSFRDNLLGKTVGILGESDSKNGQTD